MLTSSMVITFELVNLALIPECSDVRLIIYVILGPNELSIIDSEIIEAVHGTQSKCIKTEWYDMNLPMTTLHQMRDRNMHDRRRKAAWDKAFNTSCECFHDSRFHVFHC